MIIARLRNRPAGLIGTHSRGQSAVELAFIVPVLLLLLLIVIDFGRVFFVAVGVHNAARAGAQYGSYSTTLAGDSPGMTTAATTDGGSLPGFSVTNASTCTCKVSDPQTTPLCTAATGDCTSDPDAIFVEVDTQATFTTLLDYPGIPNSTTLTGKAVMQVNTQ